MMEAVPSPMDPLRPKKGVSTTMELLPDDLPLHEAMLSLLL